MTPFKADINTAWIKKFNIGQNVPMAQYTSFKIGGPADLLSQPRSIEELKSLVETAALLNLPVHIYGAGTNLLISDKGIRGLVILTRQLKSKIHITKDFDHQKIITTLSGNRLASVCRFAADHGLSGLEFAAGIPGTIGGAVMMNAGTPKGRMSDIVDAIKVLDKQSLSIKTMDKADLCFSYRNLDLDAIILEIYLKLRPKNLKAVKNDFKKALTDKKSTQPVAAASAGCFFKNPDAAAPAGKLIEDAGLKGRKINDAMVSDLHANYIVNTGKATCKDVLALKKQIQMIVYEKYGIKLETEVRVEGEN